jgi:hypothetical protein
MGQPAHRTPKGIREKSMLVKQIAGEDADNADLQDPRHMVKGTLPEA